MKGKITKILQLREVQNRISQLDSAEFSERDLFHRQTVFLIRKLFGKSSKYLDDWEKINIPQMDYNDEDAVYKYCHEWDTAKAKMANICKVMIEEINMSEKVDKTEEPVSKNVFIVHGREDKPVQELKSMLFELGLKPIILHEQASGSLTVAEKIEKYSDDVGYAFVILTPDDAGCLWADIANFKEELAGPWLNRPILMTYPDIKQVSDSLKPRARQNVVLEFGYFMGLLSRKRVCCLYTGNVELPSDMQGIVYISFEDSVNEQRIMIMKELQEVGYELII